MPKKTVPLVALQHVTFEYPNRRILENLSLTIPTGKITAIIGPSGTGKTTLIRLIGGQLYPQNGQVLFKQQDIPKLSRQQSTRSVKK